jgi:hypothetical protein
MLLSENLAALRAQWVRFRDDPLEKPTALVSFFEGEWTAATERFERATLPAERAEAIGQQLRAMLVLCHVEQVIRYREAPLEISDPGPCIVTGPYLIDLLTALTRSLTESARSQQVIAVVSRAVERASPDYRAEATYELGLLLAPEDAALLAEKALAEWNLRGHDLSRMIALLAPERAAGELAPHIARALQIENLYERWDALFSLVVALPDHQADPLLRELYERRRSAPNFNPDEIFAIYEGALDPELFRELVARECVSPFNAFTAWRLGELAEKLPANERAAIVDRAIDEFDRIALTPIDPGNDNGPFTAMAHLLDASQARRALAIVDRMSTVDWITGTAYARESLAIRLAELGHLDEADAIVATLSDAATRGGALGTILGNRLAANEALTWRECVGAMERDASCSDPEWAHDFFCSLCKVLEPPEHSPREDVIEGCLSLATSVGDGDCLECLVNGWHSIGPAERWIDAIHRLTPGTDRIEMQLAMAQHLAPRDRPAARRLLVEAMEAIAALPGSDPHPWMSDVYALRPVLAEGEWVALFGAWMKGTRGTRWPLSRMFDCREDLAGYLQSLGGDEAVVAMAQAIDEVALLLE